MPNPRLVVKTVEVREGDILVDAIFWADVPSAVQSFYADAAFVSAWPEIDNTHLAAIRSGAVVERVLSASFWRDPEASPEQMVTGLKVSAAEMWALFQAEINSRNPWVFWGTRYHADESWEDHGVVLDG